MTSNLPIRLVAAVCLIAFVAVGAKAQESQKVGAGH